METRRDQLGRFPLAPAETTQAPQHRADPWPETSDHPLARTIQLVIWGGAILPAMANAGFGGGIGVLILSGFYAIGYIFPTRWLIGGIPIVGIVAYAIFHAMEKSMERRPDSDGWDLLGLFLLFALVVMVLAAVWLGAVVGALVTRGDRRRQQAATRAENEHRPSGW
jgi:hypothetical protein